MTVALYWSPSRVEAQSSLSLRVAAAAAVATLSGQTFITGLSSKNRSGSKWSLSHAQLQAERECRWVMCLIFNSSHGRGIKCVLCKRSLLSCRIICIKKTTWIKVHYKKGMIKVSDEHTTTIDTCRYKVPLVSARVAAALGRRDSLQAPAMLRSRRARVLR